jgi:hypothetical protein
MGSGPLDQIVGLAIDRVPDSQVVVDVKLTAKLWKKYEEYG